MLSLTWRVATQPLFLHRISVVRVYLHIATTTDPAGRSLRQFSPYFGGPKAWKALNWIVTINKVEGLCLRLMFTEYSHILRLSEPTFDVLTS